MKTKVTETKFKSAIGRAGQLFSKVACLGVVTLICSSASAQNLVVSGYGCGGCETFNDVARGEIYQFTLDGGQIIFASGLIDPRDLASDSLGNLFVVDYGSSGQVGNAAIYKIAPNGTRTTFASGLSYSSDLTVHSGNLFVADYDHGIIYQYKQTGPPAIFASGLYHPVGPVFNTVGNLFVADNSIGNIYQGSIYEYKPDGSRVTFAVLDPFDRPADLAFDRMGNLLMADLGGNIYKYAPNGVRTTFGSVPNSAQSLACDSAGNLYVVDAGDVNGKGNALYKFTPQGTRSTFAQGNALGETFSHVAFEDAVCCQ